MTRKPVLDAWGKTIYLDEETGRYYEEDEAVDPDAKKVCTALDEMPNFTGWGPEEERKWVLGREVESR